MLNKESLDKKLQERASLPLLEIIAQCSGTQKIPLVIATF